MLYLVYNTTKKYYFMDTDDLTIESTNLDRMYRMIKSGVYVANISEYINPDLLLKHEIVRRGYTDYNTREYCDMIEYYHMYNKLYRKVFSYVSDNYAIVSFMDKGRGVICVYTKGFMYEYKHESNSNTVNGRVCKYLSTVPLYYGYYNAYGAVVIGFSNRMLVFDGELCCLYHKEFKRINREYVAKGVPIVVEEFKKLCIRRMVIEQEV